MCSESGVRRVGSFMMAIKVYVTSQKLANVFHAVSMQMPNIADVTSYPVYAWKKSSAWQH
jgi:hypothetical protein